ncbi:hypothetical protein LWI28_001582 [Acer negundo]|uniref:Uncharacterized protein n=1 Tax=Acer negundo TaxID=4023 RepID=A0AAD5JHU8_ACENE|nr:hypothetical protein LWI28_001582 [Acer negundo]
MVSCLSVSWVKGASKEKSNFSYKYCLQEESVFLDAKTDSNSEFGGWRMVKERARCTIGSEGDEKWQKATTLPSRGGAWPPREEGLSAFP